MSGISAADTSAARPFCRKCLLSESGFAAEYARVADMVEAMPPESALPRTNIAVGWSYAANAGSLARGYAVNAGALWNCEPRNGLCTVPRLSGSGELGCGKSASPNFLEVGCANFPLCFTPEQLKSACQ